ncbi:(deoxy)nucleoside triphosphate pyrophosphohydrolase [Enterococcus sp. JM9B]|uniref:(deoxy)nucleoside triphosphate pyrophosphohydrolase n=1 Tax=Enterococcus sp. JM9B TaxID=1857216 RepID=UPI001374A95F|nr:(deoxy)nucleoside triphosphate pyrophosphohydrolase [Enterococcus sp. JM9B]KAF1300853.1 DNA mismatch repair protein MutT [Enterococcus sp. JM9B]
MIKQINVVGAILIDDNKILCAKRGPGRALANLWEFPGGKIEKNETAREALKRELIEELKIIVSVEKEAFKSTSYEYDFGQVNLTTFICHLEKGNPVLTEHVAVEWLSVEQLNSLDWAPADIPTVQKLQKDSKGI